MSPTPAALTIEKELGDELNNMAYNHEINQFTLKKIQRQALSLRPVNPIAYYRILGRCACLAGDFKLLREHYQSALNINNAVHSTWVDLGVSLSMWGFHAESLRAFRKAHDLANGDPDALKRLFGQLWKSCRFIEAETVLTTLQTMKVELERFVPEIVVQGADLYRRNNLSDDQGLEMTECFAGLLRSHGILNPGLRVAYLAEVEVREHVQYSATIHCDDETTESIFWLSCELLAERDFPIERGGHVVFKVLQAESFRLNQSRTA